MLMGLVVTFNQPVTFDAGAFTLVDLPSGVSPGGTVLVSNGSGLTTSTVGSTVVVGFHGGAAEDPEGVGSLADGIWQMTIDMTKVHAGSTSGSGTQTVNNIRRLFGDSNGDGTIDSTDFQDFSNAFGLSSGDPLFRTDFDTNQDGVIDSTDSGDFFNRFGITL